MIIISTVRSTDQFIRFDAKHRLGFLANPKRFNVTVTRAQALLIIVGNPRVLASDQHWGELLSRCIHNGAYTGIALPDAAVQVRACMCV